VSGRRRGPHWGRAAAILLAVALVGCAPGAVDPSVESVATAPASTMTPDAATPSGEPSDTPEPAGTLVTCGVTPAFAIDLLEGPGDAETGDQPYAAALRELFETPSGSFLPTTDWRVVAEGPSEVHLLATNPSEDGFAYASFELRDDEWQAVGWGGCSPRADVGDLSLARFFLPPTESLEPDRREIDVIVSEMACAGGQSAEGRVLEPDISVSADAITVVFAVRPLGGAQNCPGHPGVPYVLTLPVPLGDRILLDGSSVPPREPPVCTNPSLVCG
jgi:hypothetical protein